MPLVDLVDRLVDNRKQLNRESLFQGVDGILQPAQLVQSLHEETNVVERVRLGVFGGVLGDFPLEIDGVEYLVERGDGRGVPKVLVDGALMLRQALPSLLAVRRLEVQVLVDLFYQNIHQRVLLVCEIAPKVRQRPNVVKL